MLAGAMGNLVDRVAFGHVIDFIDILPWFIFNVADIAILSGLIGFARDIPDVTARLLTESQEQP
jgi:signal peptidase II